MKKLQKILYDKLVKTSSYINNINIFWHPETETVNNIEVYKDTGEVCSIDLKKKQMREDAMRRWQPVIEKIIGDSNPEKTAMLTEYALIHYDAIHNSDMPIVTSPRAQTENLQLLQLSLKIWANTYKNDDFLGVVKHKDIDREDENIDGHF